MSTAKRNALLLLALGALLTLILAMSLSTLVLLPGQPLPLGQPQARTPGAFGSLPGGDVVVRLFQGILALTIILMPVVIIYLLMTPLGRRRLVVYAVFLALLFLVANYLRSRSQRDDKSGLQQAGLSGNLLAGNQTNADLLASFPTTPPAWLTVAIILVASIFVALAIYGVLFLVRQRAQPEDDSLEELAEEAQKALESLDAGGELDVTIVRCYHEMSRVVKQARGVARDSAMTPREFEARLVSQGLPREAVGTLTRLFEQVRYGSMTAGSREEDLAYSCLADIVNACKKVSKPA